MDLITLEEYKTYNGLSANPKEDAKNALLISSVSNLIQAYLGWNVSPDGQSGRQVTEVLSVDYDTNVIYLANYPISGPVTVLESDRYTLDSSIHVPLTHASDYIVNESDGTLTRIYKPGGFANWPISPGVISVTYTIAPKYSGGVSGIPADLKLAALEMVDYYKNDGFRENRSIQGTSVQNYVDYSGDFPKHVQVILDRYK